MDSQKNPYPFYVEFEKLFISGSLKGFRLTEKLGFVSQSQARFFAGRDGCIIVPAAGMSEYRQENSRVFAAD
jgi:hypothetical protein